MRKSTRWRRRRSGSADFVLMESNSLDLSSPVRAAIRQNFAKELAGSPASFPRKQEFRAALRGRLLCMSKTNLHLGVISDTHGLLRPEAVAALRGCDLIVHAGDVGNVAVLDGLRHIAPTFAIRGN